MILQVALSRLFQLIELRHETCRKAAWPAPGPRGAGDPIPQQAENGPSRAGSYRRGPPERKIRKISLTTRLPPTHFTSRLLSCNGGSIVDRWTPQPHCHSTGSSTGNCKQLIHRRRDSVAGAPPDRNFGANAAQLIIA
jgi:hypothetical protein